ncbi:hypothetical protein [uncultured Azohydromonas sp.]|uniref:hypothetical protein n=1 Tax=uncultured Azohydromonas sp. TaxID=487342 RepID=UPI002608D5FA|nr:hypothetical protein [uncultured Azohydromonas sp.]
MTQADPSRPPSAAPAAPATAPANATATPEPVDWAEESTVGEEDPGASLDLALDPPPQSPADAPAPPSRPGAG